MLKISTLNFFNSRFSRFLKIFNNKKTFFRPLWLKKILKFNACATQPNLTVGWNWTYKTTPDRQLYFHFRMLHSIMYYIIPLYWTRIFSIKTVVTYCWILIGKQLARVTLFGPCCPIHWKKNRKKINFKEYSLTR